MGEGATSGHEPDRNMNRNRFRLWLLFGFSVVFPRQRRQPCTGTKSGPGSAACSGSLPPPFRKGLDRTSTRTRTSSGSGAGSGPPYSSPFKRGEAETEAELEPFADQVLVRIRLPLLPFLARRRLQSVNLTGAGSCLDSGSVLSTRDPNQNRLWFRFRFGLASFSSSHWAGSCVGVGWEAIQKRS